jgi:hypothetical protein
MLGYLPLQASLALMAFLLLQASKLLLILLLAYLCFCWHPAGAFALAQNLIAKICENAENFRDINK